MTPPPSPTNSPQPSPAPAARNPWTPNSKAHTASSASTDPTQAANPSAGTVADQFKSNLCRICTLIFDTDPIEIGRSPTDPTICILCEAYPMASIEQVTETVTQEIFILKYTRAELEDFAAKPQRYLNDILSVLDGSNKPPIKRAAKKSKPAPSPVSAAKRGRAGVGAAVKPLLYCKYCGAQFITPGRHANHEATCIDNPVNHVSAAEE
ncbi:MAG: hypothetical protein IPK44_01675 [Candidatus Accumulibacter sp.]|uniref:hypothetical protein n=1 Tax=Accumulibacter sp. TaxID=2053492 RepID=UPI002590AF41|nr:hypothetical protein [Accumulibacter sp.]MBK8113310.1 hypothetical protein [Accumulibacter sp.]